MKEPRERKNNRGIMWYDPRKNAYTVVEHNLGPGYQEILKKHRSQGLPAYLFEHKKHHHTKDADDCQSCDRIVRRIISRRREASIIKKLLGDRYDGAEKMG